MAAHTAPPTPVQWETESWRHPTILHGDSLVFSEHGRVINHIDFRSHWLALVKAEIGGYYLLVKHGGGEERTSVGYGHTATGLLALASIDKDQRYLVLYTIMQAHQHAARNAETATRQRYEIAFLEGRLKRRKRNNRYSVEITEKATSDPSTPAQQAAP